MSGFQMLMLFHHGWIHSLSILYCEESFGENSTTAIELSCSSSLGNSKWSIYSQNLKKSPDQSSCDPNRAADVWAEETTGTIETLKSKACDSHNFTLPSDSSPRGRSHTKATLPTQAAGLTRPSLKNTAREDLDQPRNGPSDPETSPRAN